MSRHRYRLGLASCVLLTLVLHGTLSDVPAFADCSQADRNAGECRSIDGSTNNNTVIIRVDTSSPGSPGTGGSSTSSSGSSGSQPSAPQQAPRLPVGPPPPPRNPTLGSSECQVVIAGMCRGSSPPRNQPTPMTSSPPASAVTTAPTPPTPPSSISQLGSFTPERPGVKIEPGDWSMPRLPTNFIATARTHQRSGELAGWPIEVRFIPHRYHWSFGDGTRATFSDPGRTWAALGLRQFQPTPTSHVYVTPGTYQASVRVEYRAEFRFQGDTWQRLTGTVSATSQTSRIQVLTVSPLLLGD
jgi:hypothetical protein